MALPETIRFQVDTRLVAAIESGDEKEIEIARSGRTVAKLVPARRQARRKPGRLKGRIRLGAEFDAPLPGDLLDAFGGKQD